MTKRRGRATGSVHVLGAESDAGSGMKSELGWLLVLFLTIPVMFFTLNYLLQALARVFA